MMQTSQDMDMQRRKAAALEIRSLLHISSEAQARICALALKAFGDDATRATECISNDLYESSLRKQSSVLQSVNPTALSVLSCMEPLLAESMFECEPNELFLRPHTPAPLDPICIKLTNDICSTIIQTKKELYVDIYEGPSGRTIQAQELWEKRKNKLENN
jgi:hypothetical protein